MTFRGRVSLCLVCMVIVVACGCALIYFASLFLATTPREMSDQQAAALIGSLLCGRAVDALSTTDILTERSDITMLLQRYMIDLAGRLSFRKPSSVVEVVINIDKLRAVAGLLADNAHESDGNSSALIDIGVILVYDTAFDRYSIWILRGLTQSTLHFEVEKIDVLRNVDRMYLILTGELWWSHPNQSAGGIQR